MSSLSARLSLGFSSLGHSFSHLIMMLWPTVVLVLEKDWSMSYAELLPLAVAGQVLFGAGALPAGWLGDRWSTTGMMVVFFVGTGLAAIATGCAQAPWQLAAGMALTGLFGSIYHPVGMAWLVRNAVNRGKALGVNGVFGSIGIGSAALVAGSLSDLLSWRAAFIVPGALCALTGLVLAFFMRAGFVEAPLTDLKPEPEAERHDVVRAFWVLSITMVAAGLINQAATIALPKLFEAQVAGGAGSTTGIGALVAIVYGFTAVSQMVGGHLADRFRMKPVYVLSYLLQAPFLALVVGLSGAPLIAAVVAAMTIQVAATPVENGLLARYTPGRWRATAYGAKFVLTITVSALSFPLVAAIYARAGEVSLLFGVLALLAAAVGLIALLLPSGDEAVRRAAQSAAPAPGTAD
jgi:MFS transporter, FSR family, fosmidomycin resistance protein